MNKLIKTIATQTDAWCDQNWAGHEFYNIRWEEKFAELMVVEFITLADEFELDVNRSGLVDKIKHHFGIE